MGMRRSDATFLRREVLPALADLAQWSPRVQEVYEILAGRIETAETELVEDDELTGVEIHHWSHPHNTISIDGYEIPYILVNDAWPTSEDVVMHLSLDSRFGLDTTYGEVLRWAPFLANAMAVSAGRTSHGEGSYIRNPHGRSGAGDPPPITGELVSEAQQQPLIVRLPQEPGEYFFTRDASGGLFRYRVVEVGLDRIEAVRDA